MRTFIEEVYKDTISGEVDDTYLIPDGQSVVVQEISSGSSLALGNVVSTRIEIFFDPNGDGTGMTLIDTLYISINEATKPTKKTPYTGDGTARIRTRRTPLDLGSREVTVKWKGYIS